MSDAAAAAERLAAGLAAVLGRDRRPAPRIEGLRQLTGGASRETWAFAALRPGEPPRRLVVRRDPPTAIRAGGAMAIEAAAIEAARRAGVPEPLVVASGEDPAELGAPYIVMELVDGETVPRRILRDDAYAGLRDRLAERCGEALARIHSIPPEEVGPLPAGDALDRLRRELDRFEEPSPAFELGLRRLERSRPEPVPPTVVHGDFRHGNLIVDPDDLRAVLDWEMVHVGDPMEDLGYLCARCWRFGAVERPVGGFGEYADLFRGYEAISGRPVDAERVRWWELFACVRWGVGCMVQASRHLSGDVDSVELAAVGRRVCEQEYDTLLLLEASGA